MFGYACREDTYGVAANPVSATTKPREMPAAVLDFYEPEEIEALARAAETGLTAPRQPASSPTTGWHGVTGRMARTPSSTASPPTPEWRLGELVALRWEDVDFDAHRLIVHRPVSARTEGPTKSGQARALPLADIAGARPAITGPTALNKPSSPAAAACSSKTVRGPPTRWPD